MIVVQAPPIHLGVWSMALMLWLPFVIMMVAHLLLFGAGQGLVQVWLHNREVQRKEIWSQSFLQDSSVDSLRSQLV